MAKERLISLDVFRGGTVLLMTIVNNPGNWSAIYPPLEHADWNGCTPTDLVFPFFIFIMGVAIPFALHSKTFDGATFTKILARSLRIICLGIFFNYFGKIQLFDLEGIPLLIGRLVITFGVGYALLGNFNSKIKLYLALTILAVYLFLAFGGIEAYKEVRLPGVLQRIGIVYFFISILYLKSNQKAQIITAIALLLGYWALMTLVPVPGVGEANLQKGTNLAAWLDNILLKDHLWVYSKTWDPEGILSTLPAIATGIIGILIGQLLNSDNSKVAIIKKMILTGGALVLIGLVWNTVFPINKSLWTSSYVLFTAGLGILVFTLFYYIIDILNIRKGFKLFLMWGVNPMIVFSFSQIIPQGLRMIQFQNPNIPSEQINLQQYLYSFWILPYFDNPMSASLTGALIYSCIWTFILWLFYKNSLIFKV
jgi:predicted acyltransferase